MQDVSYQSTISRAKCVDRPERGNGGGIGYCLRGDGEGINYKAVAMIDRFFVGPEQVQVSFFV